MHLRSIHDIVTVVATATLRCTANIEDKYSHLIIFFSWCLTQLGVLDWGHPINVRCQYEHTEASTVKTRRVAVLTYNIKNALIRIVSTISSGRLFSVYTVTTSSCVGLAYYLRKTSGSVGPSWTPSWILQLQQLVAKTVYLEIVAEGLKNPYIYNNVLEHAGHETQAYDTAV